MGREVRRVPANWQHPTQRCEHSPWKGGCDYARAHGGLCLKPLMKGYKLDKQEFEAMQAKKGLQAAIDYFGRAPDKNDYVPDWKKKEATWFQVYETVSEGTPVTPPFATREELVEHLCTQKDFWGDGPVSRKAATAFVMEDGWAPSMSLENGVVTAGIEQAGR
jgi:hypothetical protein